MYKFHSKHIVIIALLFAFATKAMAFSAMTCKLMDNGHRTYSSMNHCSVDECIKMKLSKDKSEEIKDISSCECPSNGCTSGSFLFSTVRMVDTVTSDKITFIFLLKQPISKTSSLYRPPIFA